MADYFHLLIESKKRVLKSDTVKGFPNGVHMFSKFVLRIWWCHCGRNELQWWLT